MAATTECLAEARRSIKDHALVAAPKYYLHRDVYYCEVEDGLVFLDARREKYLALGPIESAALRPVVDGWQPQALKDETATNDAYSSQQAATAAALVEAGLLTGSRAAGKRAEPMSLECQGAIEFTEAIQRSQHIRMKHVVAFSVAYVRARLQLRFRPLVGILATVQRRRARSTHSKNADHLRTLVAVFRRLRPLAFSSRDACVLESLALLHFLNAHGFFPQWVFGIHTRPFGAHSWLQHGSLILNGTVDEARFFTPILIA